MRSAAARRESDPPSKAMKTGLLIRSVISVLALPVMLAGVLPGRSARASEADRNGDRTELDRPGFVLAVGAIRRFSTEGEGTLAPWDPSRRLVVQGTYRDVRNPMISGVLSILAGEAIFSGSLPILKWFALFAVLNAIYIPLIEEPRLVGRFGHDYLAYKENVPRWVPRFTPWSPEDK